MNGNDLNKSLKLGAKHALYREDGTWFHHLKKFPGILFDKYGFLIVKSKKEYLSNPYFQHGVDLHIKNGISSIPEYKKFDIKNIQSIAIETENIDEDTIRIIREINSIKRNTNLVSDIKTRYDNKCQICNTKLIINVNLSYSEVHHIKPLGRPHNGPDKIENMICVCPNHHVLLDLGAIELNTNEFTSIKHEISDSFIDYYNNEIYQG